MPILSIRQSFFKVAPRSQCFSCDSPPHLPPLEGKKVMKSRKVVPGGGIEPPTRGFSIHCSTPELPGHGIGGRATLGGGVLGRSRGAVHRVRAKFFGCTKHIDQRENDRKSHGEKGRVEPRRPGLSLYLSRRFAGAYRRRRFLQPQPASSSRRGGTDRPVPG